MRRYGGWWLGVVLGGCGWVSLSRDVAAAKEESSPVLRRRVFFGAQIGPVGDETRQRQGLPTTKGVEILRLLPNSSATAAGLRAGDVVLSLGGSSVDATPAFLRKLATFSPGEAAAVELFRDGKKQTKELKFVELPRESSDQYDVLHEAVESKAGRLRTIITRPKTEGKHPALLLLQGLGPATIERLPGAPADGYHQLIDDFTGRGYVTMRLDKPGCGDSLGGPLADVAFDSQLDGFRQALAALRQRPDVDPERIVLFGHSMGGTWGAILAKETPVRGIAVFGTVSRPWLEYLMETSRRQLELAGVPADEIESRMALERAGLQFIYRDQLSPEETATQHPELAEWVEQTFQDFKYTSTCHYTFFQRLVDEDMLKVWEKVPGQVLSLWGQADFIAAEPDHALIAQAVNQARPGQAEFVSLPEIDHAFHRAASQAESRGRWGMPGQVHPKFLETLRAWSKKVNGGT
ncbi:MAG: alpha/beta fold hydrolase [Planctomycetales bacterium]